MRAVQDGAAELRWFNRVLPTPWWNQGLADEDNVRQAIEEPQFTQRVGHKDLGAGKDRLIPGPLRHRETVAPRGLDETCSVIRLAWDDDCEDVWALMLQSSMRVEQRHVLVGMGRGRSPDGARADLLNHC